MYGITREQPLAKTLEQKTGSRPEDINIVINTHLHFDHAGGNTDAKSPDVVLPAFTNARYLVSGAELNHAEEPSERDRASYLPDNWRPLRKTDQLEETEANYEVVPGLTMETHPGHNRSMQCWRLDRGGQTIFGFADLIPMRAHVSLPWIMGYDLYPVETLESKKRLLPQAVHEGWIGLLYHDPDAALFRFVEEEGKIVPRPF
jgi:glyoxylase-like metal-dependent hydrolase (beta-lactamase superfamily II)